MIEPQTPLCAPACCYELHALAVHPHPTFTALPVRSAFTIRWEVFFAGTVNILRPLAVFAKELRHWCLTEFWMHLCLRRRFPRSALHRGILNSPSLLILLIHTKHKCNKIYSWTETKCNKIYPWTETKSSFPWKRTRPLGRQG